MAWKNTIFKKKWLLTLNQDVDPLLIIQQLVEVKKYFVMRQTITPSNLGSTTLIKIWIEFKESRDDTFIEIKEDLPTLKCQSGEGQLKLLTQEAKELATLNKARARQ